MRIRDLDWFGDLDDVAFLGRVWDLTSMRSTDSRYRDAAGDVHQHRINNQLSGETPPRPERFSG